MINMMDEIEDELWFNFNINKTGALDSGVMDPALALFDAFFPAKPDFIMRSNRPLIKIKQFNCEMVLNALDNYQDVIQIFDEYKNLSIIIRQEASLRSTLEFWAKSVLALKIEPDKIKKFFLMLTQAIPFTYAFCHFKKNRYDLHKNVYEDVLYLGPLLALYWLNFFGPEEELMQGGRALEENPYASEIKRFDNGLFIRAGESHFDCYTEEGRERLINAAKAMPLIKGW